MSPATVTTHQFAINNLIKVALSNGNTRKCGNDQAREATSRGRILQSTFALHKHSAILSLSNPRHIAITRTMNFESPKSRTFSLSALPAKQQNGLHLFSFQFVCAICCVETCSRGERGKHLT